MCVCAPAEENVHTETKICLLLKGKKKINPKSRDWNWRFGLGSEVWVEGLDNIYQLPGTQQVGLFKLEIRSPVH